jgi:20S proteasome subunit beta 2
MWCIRENLGWRRFDLDGPHLYSIAAHGSSDKLPFVCMGSGSLAAMAVFEDRYRVNMEVRVCCQAAR